MQRINCVCARARDQLNQVTGSYKPENRLKSVWSFLFSVYREYLQHCLVEETLARMTYFPWVHSSFIDVPTLCAQMKGKGRQLFPAS